MRIQRAGWRGGVVMCVLASLLLALVGCSSAASDGHSTGTSTSASSGAGTAPAFDLAAPGNARRVVDFLRAASGYKPVLRVEVTASSANITYLDGKKAETIGFANGAVSRLDSTVTYINQAEFDPDDFAIDDVGSLFAEAAGISGSRQQQDLQINEYDQGNVIMTVTTTPESSTVFFRPDGTAIHSLDFREAADIKEGLSDTVQGATEVTAVTIKPDALSVDVRTDAATIQQRTRQKALPTIVANIKDSSDSTPFSPSLVDPTVVASLEQSLPGQLGKAANTSVQVTIQQRSGDPAPRMTFQVGGAQVVTELDGTVLQGK